MKTYLLSHAAVQKQSTEQTTLHHARPTWVMIPKIVMALWLLCLTSLHWVVASSETNNQSEKPTGISDVKAQSGKSNLVPSKEPEIPIPADGDCLYKSIMMAYLLPVAKDKYLFNTRLGMLIGEDTIIPTEENQNDKENENKDDSKDDIKIDINQVWDAFKVRQNFLNLRRSTLIYCLRQYPFPELVHCMVP